jgi:anti-sigma B factor antagonist
MSHVVQDNGKVIITPDADIVASQAQTLRAPLWKEIEHGTPHVVVDLQHVEMVDSFGMGLFISAQNLLHAQGGKLTVMNVSEDLLRMFRLMRLDKHFAITARTNA